MTLAANGAVGVAPGRVGVPVPGGAAARFGARP
jgi:hypothetical protein